VVRGGGSTLFGPPLDREGRKEESAEERRRRKLRMARIHNDITETIGNTPLVRLNRIAAEHGAVVPA
jgi:hypothetical protein